MERERKNSLPSGRGQCAKARKNWSQLGIREADEAIERRTCSIWRGKLNEGQSIFMDTSRARWYKFIHTYRHMWTTQDCGGIDVFSFFFFFFCECEAQVPEIWSHQHLHSNLITFCKTARGKLLGGGSETWISDIHESIRCLERHALAVASSYIVFKQQWLRHGWLSGTLQPLGYQE